MEETDIRIAELKKDAYEFKRDIVVGAENMRTGKTMAEKVQKYMEDKLKNRLVVGSYFRPSIAIVRPISRGRDHRIG